MKADVKKNVYAITRKNMDFYIMLNIISLKEFRTTDKSEITAINGVKPPVSSYFKKTLKQWKIYRHT